MKQKAEFDAKRRELKDDKEIESYWSEKAAYTPESRLETARVQEEMREKREKEKTKKGAYDEFDTGKRERKFFDHEGKPYSFNDPKYASLLLFRFNIIF